MILTGSLLKWKDVRCQHPSSLCGIKHKRKSSILKFASPHKTSVFMARIRHIPSTICALWGTEIFSTRIHDRVFLLILHFHKLLGDVSQSFLYLHGYFHKPGFGKLIKPDRKSMLNMKSSFLTNILGHKFILYRKWSSIWFFDHQLQ